jgi:hypothetical protein
MEIKEILSRLEKIQDGIEGNRFTHENIQDLIRDIINGQFNTCEDCGKKTPNKLNQGLCPECCQDIKLNTPN